MLLDHDANYIDWMNIIPGEKHEQTFPLRHQRWRQESKLLFSSAAETVKQKLVYATLNSLAPGRYGCSYAYVIMNLIFVIGIFTYVSSYDDDIRWGPYWW